MSAPAPWANTSAPFAFGGRSQRAETLCLLTLTVQGFASLMLAKVGLVIALDIRDLLQFFEPVVPSTILKQFPFFGHPKHAENFHMAYPVTFHVQIKEDVASQNVAATLRHCVSRREVIQSLDQSGIVHYARLLMIPYNRIATVTEGVFAIQVLIVYDGELDALLRFMWETPALKSLFISISDIAKIPALAPLDFDGFSRYITENNLNPTAKELRNAHSLTVQQIRDGFAMPG